MNSIVNWIPTLLLIAGIIFIIIKVKDNQEPYYPLKIIGYYFLGAFRFSFNKLHIPLGFIIFLLALRSPERNKRGKRYAAVLGLIAFLSGIIIPAAVESYYQRVRYVEPAVLNIYDFDFQGHWKKVAEVLELDENSLMTARVEDLNIDYQNNGELKALRYEATWREEGGLRHASVNFHEGQKRISVRAVKVDQWIQYNRLISAEGLFQKLDQISIKDLNPEGDFAYYGLIFGGWDNFGVSNEETFIIEEDKIAPFTGELPVEGYWMKTFGMEQTGENSYGSTHGHYYLFDIQYK